MTKVILFEGLDGSGKTAIINSLQHRLEYHHHKKVLLVEEIGYSELGKSVRGEFLKIKNEKTRYLLAMAIRRENLLKLSREKEEYDYVLIDRNTPSTMVYQSSAFKYNLEQMFLDIENQLEKHFVPDITFYVKSDINRIYQKMLNDGQVKEMDEVLKYDTRYNQVMAFLRYHNWRIYELYNDKNLEFVVKEVLEYLKGA